MSKLRTIKTTTTFDRSYKRLSKKNSFLNSIVPEVVKKIRRDPFETSLHSHKVISRNHGLVYSSRVTKDLRILWIEQDKGIVIMLLDIGGHSGKNKVYK